MDWSRVIEDCLKMMKSYVPKKTEEKEKNEEEASSSISREKLSISVICASSALDELLEGSRSQLKSSFPVPRCEGADFISEKTTGTDLPPEIQVNI